MTAKAKTPKSLVFTLALIATAAAILLHGYLTSRHFQVAVGHTGVSESLCNVNAKFNCDTVAASSYSSLFGIPLALWGAITNAILLMLALGTRYTWEGASSPLSRWTSRFATITLTTTIVMAVISFTKLSVYCPFCIAAYVMSFITFAGFFALDSGIFSELGSDIGALFGDSKGLLASFVAIPVGAWLLNGMIHQQYDPNARDLEKYIGMQIKEWKTNRQITTAGIEPLAMGASKDTAKMVITEFADFLCVHCKNAAPKLHTFVKAHSDVRLEFYTFPLDGSCNPAIPRKSGAPCRLAKATFCAGDNGWKVHDGIFENQAGLRTLESVNAALKEMATEYSINHDEWLKCIESEETHNRIKSHAALGKAAGVQGTPSVYVNGRKLPGNLNLRTLKAVYKEL